VDDWEEDAIKSLLETPTGGECVFYIDSQGGSVYGSVAVTTLVRLRKLTCTGVVLGNVRRRHCWCWRRARNGT